MAGALIVWRLASGSMFEEMQDRIPEEVKKGKRLL